METIFWISISIIGYCFAGYGLIITFLARFKKPVQRPVLEDEDLPVVTVLVAAYNEAEVIAQKVENCLAFDYPADKLKLLFVTDGSNDGTPEIIQQFPKVSVLHQSPRKGKIAAVNRAMQFVDTDLVVFTDANVMINPDGIRAMIGHFQNNLVAAVSGEKRVISADKDAASASGEGLYWRYESYLKRKDAEWNCLTGSAGELFAIRSSLYEPIELNTLIEDFVMTMKMAAKGYKVAYEPSAVATETASANIAEETKRKIRISAGGVQAMIRLFNIVTPFKTPRLFFQYFSHRVMRWIFMPWAMMLTFVSAATLINQGMFYTLAFVAQVLFYLLAFSGHLLRNKRIKLKGFFAPYYFVFMHVCLVRGWFRYGAGKQKVTWQKAERAVSLQP